jgi:tetratricopeptide (TPR) repeat protein
LRGYGEAHWLVPKRLSREAEAWLRGYSWPGNVRELSHLLERVTLLSTDAVVSASTLEELCLPQPQPAVRAGAVPPVSEAEPLDEPARIRHALGQTGGNVVRAAQLLGISRGTMRYRMRQYGIGRPRFPASTPLHGKDTGAWASSGVPPNSALFHQPTKGGKGQHPDEGRAAEAWEQKPVAVLAIDVAWPEAVDLPDLPAEPWTWARRWQQTIAAKVQGFGGFLLQHAPSPLIAVFGLPKTLEQLPQRAVQVALAIRYQLAADRVLDSSPPGAAVRMAVHVGQVLVDVQAHDPTAGLLPLRETLSLPVRLLGHAAPGDILLSPQVGRQVEGWFALQVRAGAAGAGTADGVSAYAVVGVGPRRSPLEVYGKRPLSRFVGRQRELAMLGEVLAQAEQGRGQVVGLVGEPGVGKSRLCYELAQRQRTHGWRILESSPTAYGQETPYLPVIDLLKAYFQLDSRDEGQALRDKVIGKLQTLDEGLGPTLPAVLALLDVPVEDPSWQALDPPQRRQRTLEACKRLLLRESQVRPVLLVVENLHWIDSETQTFLDLLVESLPTARILLLVNYRPDYQHGWGSKTYYTQLRLDPLSTASADEFLNALLGEDPSLAPLTQLLIARTEGNPFFLEESVRTQVETGGLVGEPGAYRLAQAVPTIQVPATVQAVLAARIDRLPPGEKRLLQTAAVIGTAVPSPLLRAIAELPEAALYHGLAHLQAAEFLYETRLFPESEYTFKHALTYEVAYNSLLLERRRALHARLVEALEGLPRDQVGEQVERLAHHALRGEVWDKAVTYCQQAGARAYGRAAFHEAIAAFEQALQALARLPEHSDTGGLALDLRLALVNPLSALGENERRLSLLGEAEALARALDDRARLGQVLARMAQALRLTGDYNDAIAAGQQALMLAAALGNSAVQEQASLNLGQAYYAIGNFDRAAELLRRNVEAADKVSSTPSTVLRIRSQAWLARTLSALGAFAEGRRHGEEALRLATLEGQGNTPIVAHSCLGHLYLDQGDLEHAIRVLEQGLALCRAYGYGGGFLPVIAAGLGYTSTLERRLTEGRTLLEEAISESIRTGALQNRSLWVTWLSEVCRLAGHYEEAGQHALQALDLARQQKACGDEAYALHQLGAVQAHADPPDAAQAEAHYQQALALAEELGMRPLQAHCHLGLGTLYPKTGQLKQARDELTAAIDLYRAMDMTFWLPQAETALAQVGAVE